MAKAKTATEAPTKTPKVMQRSKKSSTFRINRESLRGKLETAFAAGRRWKRTQKASAEA